MIEAIQVVCGVISDSSGRYLVCLRKADGHLGGLWEFPGGKVETGESAAEALARELLEELGVEIAIGLEMESVVWDYGGKWIRLIPFQCTIRSGTPQPLEHADMQWRELGGLDTLDWAPADVPIVAALLAGRRETVN